ncbi:MULTISPECIES: Dot/Icm T4SS effector AnkY/LegA9 [Legionella]|uniref:Ankyrin repeat domain-containing protein n=2 Tax=Legionella septentrionalis TaxID=2498109 RepID=A0A433JGL8_9GAMM|nr:MULTISPECIES: Dot/Icm T4SS effector AnkY/LegA9 [Legionella]MCP0913430.1 ankyrin repeat domain-containing protein [Legionella sp. 27cVA30]RUQ80608.1 ankyrin repeat domain-containing protein [Legionella septentrionalis]RUQ99581.1 ankyrin repeat domain-containing protein [Legionella septentrionalis]RUR09859.1 ankyrin repeat domain-containing protein [Legionella septentrionalis]RUR12783.1 ankyrin repeat domain-containing protein [Legionella septentrionalis]
MGKVILIHANCHNSKAKGDFAFAGNIAKDLIFEFNRQAIEGMDVILVSTIAGISRFESLYGTAVDGRIIIEGTSVGLSSLEKFDAVDNTVVAFIDANRCKYSAGELVKRVLSPESKFLFVGNVNQEALASLFDQTCYRMQAQKEQPGVYESFNEKDMLIGSAGLGPDRLGLPAIAQAINLSALSSEEREMLPQGSYGFMYLAAVDSSKDYKLIAQYIKLSGHNQYVLVGDFSNRQYDIRCAYEQDTTLDIPNKYLPQIKYHQSLPNHVMRKAVANADGSLVLSTGVTSTLEAMRDSKLTYYQDMDNNQEFVAAYLLAVKSMITSDDSLFGALPQLIIELSHLLFASKPLNKVDAERTRDLLQISLVNSKLIRANQTIIEKASGKIAARLLSFIGSARQTNDQIQFATICASLRKTEEQSNPAEDQALRRAAAWDRLFELKVLLKHIPVTNLDKTDAVHEFTALHWAVLRKNLDCARALINAGASLDRQDKAGQTVLHKAVKNGDKPMIKLLIEAGASTEIVDKNRKIPAECSPYQDIVFFMKECHSQFPSKYL